jgi:hypothetical protein
MGGKNAVAVKAAEEARKRFAAGNRVFTYRIDLSGKGTMSAPLIDASDIIEAVESQRWVLTHTAAAGMQLILIFHARHTNNGSAPV